MLSPGGLAILTCSTPTSSGIALVAGFDLYTRQIKWTVDLTQNQYFGIGSDHLFLVSETKTPASGLNSGTTSYTLTAKNLDSGATSWSSALPTVGENLPDNYQLSVSEGPSGDASHPNEAVISFSGTYGFDSSTGQYLWHLSTTYDTQASGYYTGYGTVEVGDINGQWGEGLTGMNVSSDTQTWQLTYPTGCDGGFYTAGWGDQV